MKHYGILAYPASHSKSPEIHNAAFQDKNIDAIFERYEVAPKNLNTFFDQKIRRTNDIQGLAVSVPHKERVIPLLDQADEAAKKIGAVNTVYWQNEKLCGTNTDYLGFSQALREHYDVEGKKILLCGAGGSARAVIYALQNDYADQIILVNRTVEKAQQLAMHFGVQWKNLEDVRPEEYNFVINTTSLGMKGENEGVSPLPRDFWRAHLHAFDLVYTPKKTQFLKDAETAGARAYSGEKMLLYQAMEQFTIWTGEEAPREVMEQALQESMSS